MRFSRARLTAKYANRCPYFQLPTLLLVFGLMPIAICSVSLWRDLRLLWTGETARAVVRNKVLAAAALPPKAASGLLAHGGGKRGPSYLLHYDFFVNAQVFSGTDNVSPSEWTATQVGQPLEVVYLPSDPQVHRVGPPLWLTAYSTPIWGGLLLCLGGLALAVVGIRDIRHKVRLIVEGAAALGVISQVETARTKRGEYIRYVKYVFSIDTGGDKRMREAEMTGEIPYRPGELKPGDVILVAYDPDKPDRHEIDRFDARQEERLALMAVADW